MTRRMIEREYAHEECDEVCQDILTRDRIELRERTNRNRSGCQTETQYTRRRTPNLDTGNRISGQECETETTTCKCWEDPCRNQRCGCGCNYNRCGYNRRGCGYSRGLNCDRNRRLRSCRCECED